MNTKIIRRKASLNSPLNSAQAQLGQVRLTKQPRYTVSCPGGQADTGERKGDAERRKVPNILI